MKDGFIKVAAASPVIRVADCDYNAQRVIECIREADAKGVKLLVFPELTLTGVSCRDLFRHRVILNGAEKALIRVVEATAGTDTLVFVGLPMAIGPQVISVAAAIWDGELIALVPGRTASASFNGGDGEYHEIEMESFGTVPLCGDALFTCDALPELNVAVDLGQGIQSIWSDTTRHARAGAQIVCQMASFPAAVSSTQEAELLAKASSRHLNAGLILAAPGKGESSTDEVYSGLCLVAEAGKVLAQDEQIGAARTSLALSEIDVELLTNLRRDSGEFDMVDEDYVSFSWGEDAVDTALTRKYSKHPHLPEDPKDLPAYCERMLDIQVSGLVKRMEYAGLTHCVVGISGGVDSTLAVMVSAMAVKRMGLIGKSVYQHFDDIGHAHDDYSIAFENAQARERTQVLMDIANKVNGLDVGTEDLSEYIDGWCTYNGDHTSMYDVNLGLTKTQVRANVSYIAQTTEDKVLKAALYDVLDCPVTPELLPIHDDLIEQKSEDAVGSYSLQDFFTYHILQDGFTPAKTFRLAKAAYGDEFTDEELKRWLLSWCKRLFSQQFKRSCLMDGPAVMVFSVSPRSGWLIPSDGEAALFLKDLEQI